MVQDEQVTLQTHGENASWLNAAWALLRQWWRRKTQQQRRRAPTDANGPYQRLEERPELRQSFKSSRSSSDSGGGSFKKPPAPPDEDGDIESGQRLSSDQSERAHHDDSGCEDGDDDGGQVNLASLKREMRVVTDALDTVEVRCRVLGKSSGEAAVEARAQRTQLQARREELQRIVKAASSEDVKKQAVAQKVKTKKETLMTRVTNSPIVKITINAANGIMSVSLYFADLLSDVQVVQLLLNTGNYWWAAQAIFLLVAQFVVCWIRVIPYLGSSFGLDSCVYHSWLWFGFPFGLVALDFLMFLEPFGLLTVVPMPDWLRQFIPAYKATRIIAEVAIESLPQCVLQSYIYLVVINSAKAGTATPSQIAMVDFASLLPKSVLISLLSTLKTWIELVHGARQAGLSVAAKALQLWQVGAGLPLDALKKGAIINWTCPVSQHPTVPAALLCSSGLWLCSRCHAVVSPCARAAP